MDYYVQRALPDHGVSSVLNDGREVMGAKPPCGLFCAFMDHRSVCRLEWLFAGPCATSPIGSATEEELRNATSGLRNAPIAQRAISVARVSPRIPHSAQCHHRVFQMMAGGAFGARSAARLTSSNTPMDIPEIPGKHVLASSMNLLDISKESEAVRSAWSLVLRSRLNDHWRKRVRCCKPMANSQRSFIRYQPLGEVPEVFADPAPSINADRTQSFCPTASRYTPSGGRSSSDLHEPSGNVVNPNIRDIPHRHEPQGTRAGDEAVWPRSARDRAPA